MLLPNHYIMTLPYVKYLYTKFMPIVSVLLPLHYCSILYYWFVILLYYNINIYQVISNSYVIYYLLFLNPLILLSFYCYTIEPKSFFRKNPKKIDFQLEKNL